MRRFLVCSGLAVGLATGCAPVDAAGDYTVNVTNGDNGCEIDGWNEGESSSGIPMTITQDGAEVTLVVGGGGALLLNLATGTNSFTGTVTGDTVNGRIIGANSSRQGMCASTIDVDLVGTVTGDAIQGELAYTPRTNGHPDCGVLDRCSNIQRFSGSRPPR